MGILESPTATGEIGSYRGSPGSPPGSMPRGGLLEGSPTVAATCVLTGEGLHSAMARQKATFTIEARDVSGNKQQAGGEKFKVSIRGASQVRAKVIDKENGDYAVEYKASTSGSYTVSITLNGVSLPGSPFRLEVLTPAPDPTKCVLRGDALTNCKAREIATFEVEFIDALNAVARAEELDVWVEKVASGDAPPPPRATIAESDGADGAAGDGSASPAPAEQPTPLAEPSTPALATGATERLTNRQLMTADALARTGGRVEVGAKPLIVRRLSALDSEIVAMLRPGQLVTVIEELELGDGKLRAKIEQVEEEAAARAIAESWWSPPANPCGMEPMNETPLSARLSLLEQAPVPSVVGSVAAGTTEYFNDVECRPWWVPPPSPGGNGASRSSTSPGGAGGAGGAGTLTDDYLTTYIESARLGTSRSGVVGGGTVRGSGKGSSLVRGWVTLLKDGAELVAPRPRLNAGERRKHMELWVRREAADKTLKKSMETAALKGIEKELRKNNPETSIGPSMAYEVNDDPEGVAFAYGGLHPGTLHASGKLVRSHQVRYSIGRAGHYKLHVGLRAQAIALPGSPYSLYVAPSNAHALSTSLVDSLPLTGVVGDEWSCTCTLNVVDRMGNRCVTGGANIMVDVDLPEKFFSQITDNNDGSYTLQWRGTTASEYKTQVRIDHVHVHGSPMTIKMASGPPDVPKCEINGPGLKTALAGQPACVYVTCKDRYANPLSSASLAEGNALSFGLALTPIGDKSQKDTIPSMGFDGNWVKAEDHEGESFEIQYTAKEAGDFELHVWCNPDGTTGKDGNEARQWLTGSPFPVRVTGVRPSREGSFVELIGSSEVVAGESITLRPQLRDQFGNASAAMEGTFVVQMLAPDRTEELELKQLKGLGLYESSYEVTVKGRHLVHFLLNGEDIVGSPVEYMVSPAGAIAGKSKLHPPKKEPTINQQCELLLESIDKYGNKLDRGGARVDARANGPGVSPCVSEDLENGTYKISFSAAVVGETRVIVRLDNAEMPPLKITFVDGGKGGGKGKPGGTAAEQAEASSPAPAPASDRDGDSIEME